MTDVTIYSSGTLMATANERIKRCLLVPYGEECSSNLGRFKVDTGVFTIPEDLAGSVFNRDHEREFVAGSVVSLDEEPGVGIWGSVYFAKTEQGDEALNDFETGKRTKVSAEVADVRIKNGRAESGRIFGASQVRAGAFPSATLLAAAADTINEEDKPTATEEPEGGTDNTDATTTTEVTTEEFTDENGTTWVRKNTVETETTPEQTIITETTIIDTPEEENMPEATINGTLQAAAHRNATKTGEPQGMTLRALCQKLALAHTSKDSTLLAELAEEGSAASDTLFATLTDIKATGTSGIAGTISQPQWLGEVWHRQLYQRRYIPLFRHEDLTSFEVNGFRWNTPPVVDEWTGNKTAVPSAGISFEPYSDEAIGFAGAHDIDRRLKDFGFPEFWESYFRKMSESYAKKSDLAALAKVKSTATAITRGDVPKDINPGIVSIVDGALAVLDEAMPTFSIVAKDVWRSILLTPKDKIVEYLTSAMGLDDGDLAGFKIIPARTDDLAPGEVLVGVGPAVVVRELPGSPIRVEGLDMVKGGIDPGLFGYMQADTEETAAVALVTPPEDEQPSGS